MRLSCRKFVLDIHFDIHPPPVCLTSVLGIVCLRVCVCLTRSIQNEPSLNQLYSSVFLLTFICKRQAQRPLQRHWGSKVQQGLVNCALQKDGMLIFCSLQAFCWGRSISRQAGDLGY